MYTYHSTLKLCFLPAG